MKKEEMNVLTHLVNIQQQFERDYPIIIGKIERLYDKIRPLINEINQLNNAFDRIRVDEVKRVINVIKEFNALYAKERIIIHQLIDRKDDQKPFISLDEASSYLGIPRHSVYRYVRNGSLPHYKLKNKRIYLKKADLDEFILNDKNLIK